MSVLKQMKDMLAPLGIYSLDDSSLVVCELSVYAQELEKLHDSLATLLRELFISTAQSYGIEKIEELFQRVRPDLTLQERRNRIGRYMTLSNTDFSHSSIEGQLTLAGAVSDLVQGEDSVSFPSLIASTDIRQVAEQLSMIEDIIPAHLGIEVGIESMSWDEMDGLDFNFGTFDKMGLRFDIADE
ncbi:MAG: hypothetical protein IKY44_05890 [Clostridia bacterium]|nr:hypothetical protein [Clostridia bacterium]